VLPPGYRIGNYEVVRSLGAGGQGVVYLARHVMLDRLDAVKVLQPHPAGDPEARKRFEREAVGAAKLRHPNIAGVHDAGQAPDGSWYVAMQYVDGPSLDRVIPSHGLSLQRTAAIIAGIADALDAAHAQGLVHRDVKPGNVMVAQAGTATEHAYLVDFGIAKLLDGSREARTVGQIMGTYAYIAPERMDWRSDGRADQYSLACTAFHCLTGAAPFPSDAAAIKAHLADRPPVASTRRGDLSPAVDAVLARGMARDPAARYPSCTAFATALREAANVHNGVKAGAARTLTVPTAPGGPTPTRPYTMNWLPQRPAAIRPWDTGRNPQTWLGLLIAAGTAYLASVPLQRLAARSSAVPIDLSVQFAALMLLALASGAFGAWLLARRATGAWFMLLLSTLTVPALRGAITVTGGTPGDSLDTALQWVAFQPLESGYSAFTVDHGVVTLSRHGMLLTGVCVVMAVIYVLGWWVWSNGTAHIGRTPRRQWPWIGGAIGVLFVTVIAFGDLPSDDGVLIALALALSVGAAYLLARKYIEGWLLFLAAQVCQLSYALTISDAHARPPSMQASGLVPDGTPISAAMAIYYVVTLAVGALGLLWWTLDRRRTTAAALARRYGSSR
jgi:serine/threonine-protein kinase